jgi:hypothetical protein
VHQVVDDRLHAPLAALGRVVEGDRAPAQPHVVLADRRQAVGLVLDRVVLAADAEEAAVEQPHRAGEHLLAAEPVGLEVARYPPAH